MRSEHSVVVGLRLVLALSLRKSKFELAKGSYCTYMVCGRKSTVRSSHFPPGVLQPLKSLLWLGLVACAMQIAGRSNIGALTGEVTSWTRCLSMYSKTVPSSFSSTICAWSTLS